MQININEYQGRVTLRAIIDGEAVKLEVQHLEEILDHMHNQGMIYAEKIGKDKLKTLLLDK
jgi:CRP-like cAMP-binding protein